MNKQSLEHLIREPTKRVRMLGLSLVAVVAVIFAGYYISVVSPLRAHAFSGTGSGTTDFPYRITNCVQLQEMKNNPTAAYALMNNIDCTDTPNWNAGLGFEPINFVGGQLDGRNYSITGLYVNRTVPTAPANGYAAGLFSFVNGSSQIRNFTLLNSDATRGHIAIQGVNNVGAVAGELREGSIIENVHSELTVQARASTALTNGNVGGVVGLLRGVLNNSSSTGNVSAAKIDLQNRNFNLGGLVGSIDASNGPEINNSYATGTVSVIDDDATMHGTCGGFIGSDNSGVAQGGPIRLSYASGHVRCDPNNMQNGGFI